MVGMLPNDRDRTRCRERLSRLSESALESESIQLEAIAELRRTVGFDRWCWPLADPQTLIPLAGAAEHDYGPAVARSLQLEYSGTDVAAMHVLARRTIPVASLSAETSRDLPRSPRWDEVLRPVGIGDEAVLACRDRLGCWGWIKAYRDSGDPPFDEFDLKLLAEIAPSLGCALRRGIGRPGRPDAATPSAPSGPGVIVLDQDLRPISSTKGARSWLEGMPMAGVFATWGILPAVVYPVATLARSNNAAEAHALERAVDGRWVKIEAAPLEGDDGKVALVLRGATAVEMFNLLCRAHALTKRERQIVATLVAGNDTRAVSQQLVISRHTVQDHLKSIFAKVGIRSRRELLAMFTGFPP